MVFGSTVVSGILEMVEPMYAAESLSDLHGVILRGLEGLVPGECYDLVVCGGVAWADGTFHARPGTYQREEIDYLLSNAKDHPVAQAFEAGASGASRISDFASDRQWRSSQLFSEGGYRRMGLTRELAINVPGITPGNLAAVSVVRGGLDFSDGERDILNHLQPLLVRAWQRVQLRERQNSPEVLRLQFPKLSRREAEVLFWIVEGKLNVEVADILSLRLGTVQEHVENIIRKLGMENRHQLAVFVLRSCHRRTDP